MKGWNIFGGKNQKFVHLVSAYETIMYFRLLNFFDRRFFIIFYIIYLSHYAVVTTLFLRKKLIFKITCCQHFFLYHTPVRRFFFFYSSTHRSNIQIDIHHANIYYLISIYILICLCPYIQNQCVSRWHIYLF